MKPLESQQDRMPIGLPLQVLPIFFFLHIPKTAGSTLNNVLAGMFGNYTIFHQRAAKEIGGNDQFPSFLENNPGFYDQVLLIVGHYGINHALVQKARRRKIILSIFRDPVERIVSLYDYIRFRPDHPQHQLMQTMSLREAIQENSSFRANCLNAQIRTVFGSENLDEIKKIRSQRNYIIGRYDNIFRFLKAVEAISGLTRRSGIPHLNAKMPLPGVVPAREQPDFDRAIEDIRLFNAAEITFFEQMPPIIVTQKTA